MAEQIEVPSFDKALSDFWEIGNWPMGTFSIFLISGITSIYFVKFHMESRGHFSPPIVIVMLALAFILTFGHYRLTTLNLHHDVLVFLGTLGAQGGVYYYAAQFLNILPQ